jgi:hypothetical protein
MTIAILMINRLILICWSPVLVINSATAHLWLLMLFLTPDHVHLVIFLLLSWLAYSTNRTVWNMPGKDEIPAQGDCTGVL